MSESSLVPAAVAAVAAAAALLAWPWTRSPLRLAVVALATFAGYAAWHLLLDASRAVELDVDNPALLGLSAEDVGSGVLAFALSALGLGLAAAPKEAAARVVAAAAVAGAIAVIVDRFS